MSYYPERSVRHLPIPMSDITLTDKVFGVFIFSFSKEIKNIELWNSSLLNAYRRLGAQKNQLNFFSKNAQKVPKMPAFFTKFKIAINDYVLYFEKI